MWCVWHTALIILILYQASSESIEVQVSKISFDKVTNGKTQKTGQWCEGETQRNYEIVVSPRLVDSVPCLELYRSVHNDWLYDESRMQDEHGGEEGVQEYFKREGALAECYIYKPAVKQNVVLREATSICCDGWTGSNCNIPAAKLGECFHSVCNISPKISFI